jgi:hypothetical protein
MKPPVTFGPSPSGHHWMANGYLARPAAFGGRCIVVQCSGCGELGFVWHTTPAELRRLDKSNAAFCWPEWWRVMVVTAGPPLEFTHERRHTAG